MGEIKNENFTKICPCFGFANVAQNVDIQSSNNSRLRKTIDAAVRYPTATPPPPTLGQRPSGWEPLV